MFASREAIAVVQSRLLVFGSRHWRLQWYKAISFAIVEEFSEYSIGED